MSYVDEVIGRVVKENPNEPEFHQAVKEVLDSLRPVVDANAQELCTGRDSGLTRANGFQNGNSYRGMY